MAEMKMTETVHGVLLDVHGVGLLITGKSGVGKSETALELIKRGHRLISDDIVAVKKKGSRLFGSAPELIRNLIEIRGLGIIDISVLFGLTAVIPEREIELVVELEDWNDSGDYDRLGDETRFVEICGVKIPQNKIPVRHGRNLAIIMEVAAANFRNRSLGFNIAHEIEKRYK